MQNSSVIKWKKKHTQSSHISAGQAPSKQVAFKWDIA